MGHRGDLAAISHKDMLLLLEQTGHEHGVRIRISINPLPGRGRKQGFALLATAYSVSGSKLADVAPEQLLWPSVAHKTFEGAVVYMLHRLDQALDEWEHVKLRDLSTLPVGALTPLEEYIAGS